MQRAAWQPGQPVVTSKDHANWQAWRRARILERQRWRWSRMQRIDYYLSKEAAAAIDSLRTRPRGWGCQLALNIAVWRGGMDDVAAVTERLGTLQPSPN